MFMGLLILLLCQLLGEWLVMALALPVPGPVMGMVLMLVALIVMRRVPEMIRTPSEGLLRHLALLFVPAGVGLTVHAELIAREWLVILSALVVSTVITIIVTALVLKRLTRNLQLDAGEKSK